MICYQYVTLNQIDFFFKRTHAWDQYERHSKCDYDQTKSLLMRNIYKNQTEIRCVNTAVIGLTCHQRVLFFTDGAHTQTTLCGVTLSRSGREKLRGVHGTCGQLRQVSVLLSPSVGRFALKSST